MNVVIFSAALAGCADDEEQPLSTEASCDATSKSDECLQRCEDDSALAWCQPPVADVDPPPLGDDEGFATTPTLFKAELGAGDGQLCYGIRADKIIDCDENPSEWDLMVEVDGMSFSIWTNGGVHGTGDGASFGPMTKDDLTWMTGMSKIPGWFADQTGGAFLAEPWQDYNVYGTHDITANQRVYVVETEQDEYRVQVLSYYSDGGASGMLQLRFNALSDDPADASIIELDARAGGFGAGADDPSNRFTYLDLDTGELLELSDAEARDTNTAWDLGFKRNTVITNSGISGTADTTRAATAVFNEHLYNDAGLPIKSAFEALDQDTADAAFASVVSSDGLTFIKDSGTPYLIGDGKSADSWFQMDFGAGLPTFSANPDAWWAVRSSSWDAFAKLRVVEVGFVPGAPTKAFHIELYRQLVDVE